MAKLYWHVSRLFNGTIEVVIEHGPVNINRRDYMETCGCLIWDGDQFAWALPEEAYMAAVLTPKQVAQIVALLGWLNRSEV